MKRQEIIDFYVKNGCDFPLTQNETQLPAFRLQILLAKAGVLKIQDKINYGSKAQKLGGLAEQRFQELVPKAVDANRVFKKNNPCFDFVVDQFTIDVKYSSLHVNNNRSAYWKIRVTGDQDCIVAFLESENEKGMTDPYILFLPMAFIDETQTHIHISKGCVWAHEFRIEATELASIVAEYAEMKREGLYA
ncbi:hypothetical protein NG891_14470 [Enterococcus gallinarum]|uniref:hypothetical protein n=1 Tax=Enterococcus gallinarum TaxID=1353 RepID=UPI002091335D|nr:hypothetical protein [Enterococcus gallinarum]MCO5477950.1 hypothetical protein [Enterococcus gallinarum]